jgi:hypothetical protein
VLIDNGKFFQKVKKSRKVPEKWSRMQLETKRQYTCFTGKKVQILTCGDDAQAA